MLDELINPTLQTKQRSHESAQKTGLLETEDPRAAESSQCMRRHSSQLGAGRRDQELGLVPAQAPETQAESQDQESLCHFCTHHSMMIAFYSLRSSRNTSWMR